MQSDPWWSLSMAINVFMVFFLHFNADVLMKYMWIYNVISFGMPAIPAILCLFVRPDGITMYGNATVSASFLPFPDTRTRQALACLATTWN